MVFVSTVRTKAQPSADQASVWTGEGAVSLVPLRLLLEMLLCTHEACGGHQGLQRLTPLQHPPFLVPSSVSSSRLRWQSSEVALGARPVTAMPVCRCH